MLRAQRLEPLAGLVAHHTRAPFETNAQGWAVTDAPAYSDLTTGTNRERVTVRERVDEIEPSYGDDSVVVTARRHAADYLGAMSIGPRAG